MAARLTCDLLAAGYFPMAAVGIVSAGWATVCSAGFILAGVASAGTLFFMVDEWPCPFNMGSAVLVLPIGGPLLYEKHHSQDWIVNRSGSPVSDDMSTVLRSSAASQTVGLGLVLLGLAAGGRERARVQVVPSSPNASIGASLLVSDW